jgi:hypothetical protein
MLRIRNIYNKFLSNCSVLTFNLKIRYMYIYCFPIVYIFEERNDANTST